MIDILFGIRRKHRGQDEGGTLHPTLAAGEATILTATVRVEAMRQDENATIIDIER